LNKVYICSTNLSGKSYLLSLLDGHSQTATYPYHKFGISHLVDIFYKRYLLNQYPVREGYFNTKKEFILSILNEKSGNTYNISFGELFYFMIKEFDSSPNLIHSHFTKQCSSYSSDQDRTLSDMNINLDKIINSLIKRIKSCGSNPITVEMLDDYIYESYINGFETYLNKHINFILFGANGPQQINNLFKYYDNFKILYIKRDPIAISYANAKRILSKENKPISKKSIFYLMLKLSKNQLKKINESYQCASKYKNSNKIKFIDFEELIINTKDVMNDVSEFLNIKYENILIKPTMFNNDIGITNMVDDPYKIFTNYEIDRLNFAYKKKNKILIYNIFRIPLDMFYILLSNSSLFSILYIRLIKPFLLRLRRK